MKRIIYNKLIRDKIANHLDEQDDILEYHIEKCSTPRELKSKFEDKLLEEIYEFLEDPCPEEAADVLEVFEGMLKLVGIERSEVDDARFYKAIEKGRFENGCILHSIVREEK